MTCRQCDLSIFTIGDPVTRVATIPEATLEHRIASTAGATGGNHGDFRPIQADSYRFSFSAEGLPQAVERLGSWRGAEVSFSGECPSCHSIYAGHGTLCRAEAVVAGGGPSEYALRVDRCQMLVRRPERESSER